MARASDPLDMSPDERQARLINVGLSLAREVGTGLPLVNALRDRYPDVALGEIGKAAGIIGQGINSALSVKDADPGAAFDLEGLPTIPNSFFGQDESARVSAFADVSFEAFNSDNDAQPSEVKTWDVRVDCSEITTFDELLECIESQWEEYVETGPDITFNAWRNLQVNLYFMGKRF